MNLIHTIKQLGLFGITACILQAQSVTAQDLSQQEMVELLNKQSAQIEALQQQVESLHATNTAVTEDEVKEYVQQEVQSLMDESTSSSNSMYDSVLETLSKTQIHGYVGQGFLFSTKNDYLYSNTSNGELQFNEAAINFLFDLSDELNVGLQVISRDIGELGNNALLLDWAVADYRFQDWLGVRAGKLKIPHGLYNESRDLDIARTSILLPQSVYDETLREFKVGLLGGGLYGNVDLNTFGSIEYQALAGSQSIDDENTGIRKLVASTGLVGENMSSNFGVLTSSQLIWNTPLDGLRVAGSLLTFNESQFTSNTVANPVWGLVGVPIGVPVSFDVNDFFSYVVSAEYTWNDLVLASEYISTNWDTSSSILGPLGKTRSDGFYVRGDYRLNELLTLGAYYSLYFPNRNDRDGDRFTAAGTPDWQAWTQDIAVTTRFDITENWVAKLEGHYIEGTGQVSGYDNPGGLEKDAFLFAAKVSFTF